MLKGLWGDDAGTGYGTATTRPQPDWLLQGARVDRAPPALRRLVTIRVPPSRASAERAGEPKPVELTTRMVRVMTAQAQHAHSGRFIRAYLLVWGLLAAGGLAYLASLAFPLDIGAFQHLAAFLRPQAAQPAIDPEQGVRLANKALAQIDSVQHTVSAIEQDVGRLKDTVDQHDVHDREAQSRLAALEERVTNLASTPSPAVATAPSAQQKAAERAKAAAEKQREAAARIVSAMEQGKSDPPAPTAMPPKLETGSIASPPPSITFGAPEVTPAQTYAVQLASAPSLDALRTSWQALREEHGERLGTLKPRYVATRGGTGPYGLIVGRLASKAEAEQVCADIGLARKDCFVTTAMGKPL